METPVKLVVVTPSSQQSQQTPVTPTGTTMTAAPTTKLYPLRINPLKMITSEFGSKWGNQSSELRGTCLCNIVTTEQLVTRMPTGYHHVQSILHTNEAIFSCTSGVGSIVLMHMKIQPQKRSCDLLVRSSSSDICQEHIHALSNYLSNNS